MSALERKFMSGLDRTFLSGLDRTDFPHLPLRHNQIELVDVGLLVEPHDLWNLTMLSLHNPVLSVVVALTP